jgi:ribosomal protein S18 acetylase RimI-like enzyme
MPVEHEAIGNLERRAGRGARKHGAMTELRKPAAFKQIVRPATIEDIPALVALENRTFSGDLVSARSFRHLLTRGNAVTIVDEAGGAVRGYAVLLFKKASPVARLYSFAVAHEHRGRGIAKALLAEAERIAAGRGCGLMRLEVRKDNAAAQALYRKLGYRETGTAAGYYDDRMTAVRMEKPLAASTGRMTVRVPYYPQSLGFTCGPAALSMAMAALDPRIEPSRKLELRLWRESTTVFMTSGHGGCSPFGMALSAHARGFEAEVRVSHPRTLFEDGVRKPAHKKIVRLVQQDFLDEMRKEGIRLTTGRITAAGLIGESRAGGIPIVLVSAYRIDGDRQPHWVVMTGFDERFIYVHDPAVDWKGHRTTTNCSNMPIAIKDFERTARYGRAQQKAALVIRARKVRA